VPSKGAGKENRTGIKSILGCSTTGRIPAPAAGTQKDVKYSKWGRVSLVVSKREGGKKLHDSAKSQGHTPPTDKPLLKRLKGKKRWGEKSIFTTPLLDHPACFFQGTGKVFFSNAGSRNAQRGEKASRKRMSEHLFTRESVAVSVQTPGPGKRRRNPYE